MPRRKIPRATRKQLQKSFLDLAETIEFYANPENYHAIGFIIERPAGAFDDDFSPQSHHGHPYYDREMPGRRAREALEAIPQEVVRFVDG